MSDGLSQERLTEALKAYVETTGGLMVGDRFTVDGYTVTVGEGSTIRITPPAPPLGGFRTTTGFRIDS